MVREILKKEREIEKGKVEKGKGRLNDEGGFIDKACVE